MSEIAGGRVRSLFGPRILPISIDLPGMASGSADRGGRHVPRAARMVKVIVVILLIGMASPFLG